MLCEARIRTPRTISLSFRRRWSVVGALLALAVTVLCSVLLSMDQWSVNAQEFLTTTATPEDKLPPLQREDCPYAVSISADPEENNSVCSDKCRQITGFRGLLSQTTEHDSSRDDSTALFYKSCRIVREASEMILCFGDTVLGTGLPPNPEWPPPELPPDVVKVNTMAQCQGVCQMTHDCAYFTWNIVDHYCILHPQISLDELFHEYRTRRLTTTTSTVVATTTTETSSTSTETSSTTEAILALHPAPMAIKLAPILPRFVARPVPRRFASAIEFPKHLNRLEDSGSLPNTPCDQKAIDFCLSAEVKDHQVPNSCIPRCTGIYACIWSHVSIASGPRRCSSPVDMTCPPPELHTTPFPDLGNSSFTGDPSQSTSDVPPTGIVVAVCVGAILFIAISGAFWQFGRALYSIRTAIVATPIESTVTVPDGNQRQPASFEQRRDLLLFESRRTPLC